MKAASLSRHRRSIRLAGYDYAQPGAYFVTLMAAGRECLFGEVVGGDMYLSKLGPVAEQQWLRLPRRFPNLELGAVAVMPNHVHGILMLRAGRGTARDLQGEDEEASRRAPTEAFQRPVPRSIPTIIRSYKAAVTYRARLIAGNRDAAIWQRNYYEHVIRDEKDRDRIHRYIESNPALWAEDVENPAL